MITKELKFLELEDNREGIDKIIKEECKGESIDIYVDFRDFENLEPFVLSCDNINEFCDKIYESYQEGISEQEYDLSRLIAKKLCTLYGYDDVTESLFNYIFFSIF